MCWFSPISHPPVGPEWRSRDSPIKRPGMRRTCRGVTQCHPAQRWVTCSSVFTHVHTEKPAKTMPDTPPIISKAPMTSKFRVLLRPGPKLGSNYGADGNRNRGRSNRSNPLQSFGFFPPWRHSFQFARTRHEIPSTASTPRLLLGGGQIGGGRATEPEVPAENYLGDGSFNRSGPPWSPGPGSLTYPNSLASYGEGPEAIGCASLNQGLLVVTHSHIDLYI